jgi:hypothetical protein
MRNGWVHPALILRRALLRGRDARLASVESSDCEGHPWRLRVPKLVGHAGHFKQR